MKFFDNHNHSTFSPDSVSTVEAAIRRAMELGLAGIAITDHYDIDAPSRDQEFFFDPAAQQAEIDRVVMELGSDMLKSGFQVMKGIEVGLQPGIMDKIKNFTSSYNSTGSGCPARHTSAHFHPACRSSHDLPLR